jgi:hypothetical protein
MNWLRASPTSEPGWAAVAGMRDKTDDLNVLGQWREERSVIRQDLQIPDEIRRRQLALMTRYVASARVR